MRKRECILAVFFLFFWTFLVLYPQPTDLVKSVYRLFNHPVEPDIEEVCDFAKEVLGKNPSEIETEVLAKIPYRHDWETYGVPWYFPTTREVFATGEGDCKSRFIVTASVFERMDIPYQLYLSTSHVWINYKGKIETSFENSQIALLSSGKEGIVLKSEREVDWERTRNSFTEAFWRRMPQERKKLLYAGPYLSFSMIAMSIIFFKKKKFISEDL